MTHNKMRWLCGWLVCCLLLGMVSVGLADEVELELSEEYNTDEEIQLELGEDAELAQDADIANLQEIDLNADIILDGLDGALETDVSGESSIGEENANAVSGNVIQPNEDYKTVYWVYSEYKSKPLKKLYLKKQPYAASEDAGYIYGLLGKKFAIRRFIENNYGNLWAETDDYKYLYAGYKKVNGRWVESPPENDSQEFTWERSLYDEDGLKWENGNLSGLKLVAKQNFKLTGVVKGKTHVNSMPSVIVKVCDYIGGKLGETRLSISFDDNGAMGDGGPVFFMSQLNDYNIFERLPVGQYALVVKPGFVEYFYHVVYFSDSSSLIVPFQIVYGSGHTADTDTTPPIISNIKVSDVTPDGYTVTCTVSDDVGVTSVKFPTWTAQNDQDDIIWYEGQLSGNTATCTIRTSDHNNEKGCVYYTHIYAYDAAGNSSCDATFAEVPAPDAIAPVISNVSVSNVTSDGYTVSCNVADNVGVTSVKFPTWTEQNGQDDLIWHEGQLSGDKASVYISVMDHKNENGCVYFTHIYAYDAAGNYDWDAAGIDVPPPDKTAPTISNVSVSNVTSEGYTVTCNVADNVGVTAVSFPTWTEQNGQDDIIWHEGQLSGNKASVYIKVSDHNNERGCTYITHIYAIDAAENYSSFGTSANVPLQTISPTGIRISDSSLNLTIGDTYSLDTIVSPSNASDKSVYWSSSNTGVATVSDGDVTAVGAGTATITAKTVNGLTASCAVTVKAPKPNTVILNKSKATVVVGAKLKLVPSLAPSNAQTTFKWASSNKKVATVDANGSVKAVAKGTATITVKTANGKTATCKITVPKAPTKVKFKKGSYSVKKGKTITLKPVLSPSGAKTTFKWTSSNKKVATVNNKGVVKGIAKGTAKITVKTANGKSKTVTVKVK